jgi:hypothetical protein
MTILQSLPGRYDGVSYLAAWYDPGLKIKDHDTIETIAKEERERLTKLLEVCKRSQTIPRRVGTDANSDELSADRRRAKRIQHVADQCLGAWGGPVTLTQDVNREAAQVNWERWWEEHQVWLSNRTKYVATWGQLRGETRWAKSAVVRLNNEQRWLEYALR